MADDLVSSKGGPRRMPPAQTRPNWGLLLLRGLASAAFGIAALALPGPTLATLVLIFGAYMLVDGAFALAAAVRAARSHERWVWFALEGLANIIVAVIALAWPASTVIAFVAIAAAWALLSGVFLIIAAFRSDGRHGRWLMALGGLVSVAWGVLLLLWPVVGALTMVLWLGVYALIFGITFIVLAFRLRRGVGQARENLASRGRAADLK